jgi:hypothetical protein
MIERSGRWPWRDLGVADHRRCACRRARRQSPGISISTACASNARTTVRRTSVSESVNVPGWTREKRLVAVTAYHSFGGEVEALNTPRYATSSVHAVTKFRKWLPRSRTRLICLGPRMMPREDNYKSPASTEEDLRRAFLRSSLRKASHRMLVCFDSGDTSILIYH